MAIIKYNSRTMQKHDSSTNWKNQESIFVPLPGEIIVYDDLEKIKIGNGSTTLGALPFFLQSELDNKLSLSGGTITKTGYGSVVNFNRSDGEDYTNSFVYYQIGGANKAATGYYGGMAFVANEATYARIGVTDDGTPQYWSSTNSNTAKTLIHAGNYASYALPLSGGTMAGELTITGNLNHTSSTRTSSFIRFYEGSVDGKGIAIGDGGFIALGSGESATNLISNLGLIGNAEEMYISSDSTISFYTNCQTISNKNLVLSLDTNGEAAARWLHLKGVTTEDMTPSSANPYIKFSENGAQPIYLMYGDYDSYRAPAGLKIMGDGTSSSSSPAWLEVEGDIYVGGKFVGTADAAIKVSNLYSSRPTSANLPIYGDGGLRTFLATSSMSEGVPFKDGHIIHMDWDTSAGWSAQIYVSNYQGQNDCMGYRQMKEGTWQNWIKLLDVNNYSSYALPLSGGTLKGALTLPGGYYAGNSGTTYGINLSNSDLINVNGIYFSDACDGAGEGINFYRSATTWDRLWAYSGVLNFTVNETTATNNTGTKYIVLHSGNWSSYAPKVTYGTDTTGPSDAKAGDIYIRI